MIKVNGYSIKNFPDGMENSLDILLEGILNSVQLHYLKTPLRVYGRNEDEILKYVNEIRIHDSTYDIVDIYTEYDEDLEERKFKRQYRYE